MDTSSGSDAFCFVFFYFKAAFPPDAQRAIPTNSARRIQQRLFVVLFSAILSLRYSNKLNMTKEREGRGIRQNGLIQPGPESQWKLELVSGGQKKIKTQ